MYGFSIGKSFLFVGKSADGVCDVERGLIPKQGKLIEHFFARKAKGVTTGFGFLLCHCRKSFTIADVDTTLEMVFGAGRGDVDLRWNRCGCRILCKSRSTICSREKARNRRNRIKDKSGEKKYN